MYSEYLFPNKYGFSLSYPKFRFSQLNFLSLRLTLGFQAEVVIFIFPIRSKVVLSRLGYAAKIELAT